jgi:hypothetical protein
VDSVLLQDWVSLSLGSGVTPGLITQGADDWQDLTSVTDAVFYLDVKQPGSGVTLAYQTAPCREDASFVTMVAVPITSTTTTRSDPVIAANAAVPVAKYVRWQLSFGSVSGITFRVWLATYSIG